MSHHPSAADLSFLQAFEGCKVLPEEFSHREHVRIAYIYLCDHDVDSTCDKVRDALCRFLKHLGIEPSSKYHVTITRAWILVVEDTMKCTPDARSAAGFISANPSLLDADLLNSHYSGSVLTSSAARTTFVEPDLCSLQTHSARPHE